MRDVARWVLFAGMVLLVGCGGSGGGEDDRRENDQGAVPALICGGAERAGCPVGYRCVDDASRDCAVAAGGGCTGLCVLGEPLSTCAGPTAACSEGFVCVDDPSDECAGGPAGNCPGVCQPAAGGECQADSDCASILAPCSECPDGTFSCPIPVCHRGHCSITFKACPPATCAGFFGTSCAPGDECVDDPTDECDPASGGADCPGTCVPLPKPGCGGFAGVPCPDGFQCVDDPNDDCRPDASGADCPGLCEPIEGPRCSTDSDCPVLRAPCSVCPDGTAVCPRSLCQNGVCSVEFPTCGQPLPCGDEVGGCKPGYVCHGDPNTPCDPSKGESCDGMCVLPEGPHKCGGPTGEECPEGFACVDEPADDCLPDAGGAPCPGICEPANTGECRSDADCPVILVACAICPDGSAACPRGSCEHGKCRLFIDVCEGPGFCGGIAGFPCAPGYTCVDDPEDDCDPSAGGADCGGVCVREDAPRPCGGFAGFTCPAGFECADDARDDCDPEAAGGAACPGICRPAPTSKCNSDADCFVIGAPCVICADGTAACPRSFCADGECRAEFETCAEENAGS